MQSRLTGVAAAALGIGLAAAACSSGGTPASRAANAAKGHASSVPSQSPASGSRVSASAGTIGAGCGKIPASGMGSLSGMASAPVATAASHNPQLTDLAHAISAAGLTSSLNSAKAITVFAPDNAALRALGSGNVKTLMANRPDLVKVLQYHVVNGRVTPAELATGKPLMTQLGLPVRPARSGHRYKINSAEVVCGNIQTANATVYIVSKVLIPTT